MDKTDLEPCVAFKTLNPSCLNEPYSFAVAWASRASHKIDPSTGTEQV